VQLGILVLWQATAGFGSCLIVVTLYNIYRYKKAWQLVRSKMPHIVINSDTITLTSKTRGVHQVLSWSEVVAISIKKTTSLYGLKKDFVDHLHDCILKPKDKHKNALSFQIEHFEETTKLLETIALQVPAKIRGYKEFVALINDLKHHSKGIA
jgi:hypothetical protein